MNLISQGRAGKNEADSHGNSREREFPSLSEPSCSNCDAEMTHDHQCETIESDSSWEDVENDQDLYPTLDVESQDWDEKFTNSIRRYHGIYPN